MIEFKYINSRNEEINFFGDKLQAYKGNIHSRKWTVNSKHKRIGSSINFFEKDYIQYDLTLCLRGSLQERYRMLDSIHDIFEYDVNLKKSGKLYFGSMYIDCFIIESDTVINDKNNARTDVQLTVYCPNAQWIKEVTSQFVKQEETKPQVVDVETKKGNIHYLNHIAKDSTFDASIYGNTTKTDDQLISVGEKLECDKVVVFDGSSDENWDISLMASNRYRIDLGDAKQVYPSLQHGFGYLDGFISDNGITPTNASGHFVVQVLNDGGNRLNVWLSGFDNGTQWREYLSNHPLKLYYQSTSYKGESYYKEKVIGKNMMPIMTVLNVTKVLNNSGTERYGYLFYTNEVMYAYPNSDLLPTYTITLSTIDINTMTIINNYSMVNADGSTRRGRLASKGAWYAIIVGTYKKEEACENLNRMNIQLEYGDTNTSYEPYHEYGSQIIMDGLNGINGIEDTLEINGEIECNAKATLNGSEDWIKSGVDGVWHLHYAYPTPIDLINASQYITSKEKAYSNLYIFSSNDAYTIEENHFGFYMGSEDDVRLRLKDSSVSSVDELKNKIRNNPITIYYKSTSYTNQKMKVVKHTKRFGVVDMEDLDFALNENNVWRTTLLQSTIKRPNNYDVYTWFMTTMNLEYNNFSNSQVANTNRISLVPSGNVFISSTEKPSGKLIYELATPQVYCYDPIELKALGNDTVSASGESIFKYSYIEDSTEMLDYPYDFSFDYTNSNTNEFVDNDSFKDSEFKIIVYGHCSNPTIYIGDKCYRVNVDLAENEYLTIDSMTNKIFVTDNDGHITNVFNKRARKSDVGNDIFEPIPSGRQTVSWNQTFKFDIIVIQTRSEPRWI